VPDDPAKLQAAIYHLNVANHPYAADAAHNAHRSANYVSRAAKELGGDRELKKLSKRFEDAASEVASFERDIQKQLKRLEKPMKTAGSYPTKPSGRAAKSIVDYIEKGDWKRAKALFQKFRKGLANLYGQRAFDEVTKLMNQGGDDKSIAKQIDQAWRAGMGRHMASRSTNMNLRSKLIRLAHENPEMRPHLLPILKREKKAANTFGLLRESTKYVLDVIKKERNPDMMGEDFEWEIARAVESIADAALVYDGEVEEGLWRKIRQIAREIDDIAG